MSSFDRLATMQLDEIRLTSKDARFGLLIERPHVQRLVGWCSAAGAVETGGILVGRYSAAHDMALVTSVLGPPPDSRAGRTWFLRGVRGLQHLLNAEWHYRRQHYLGEWHYHPHASPRPSSFDYAQMATIARRASWHCPEPVLLVVGGAPPDAWSVAGLVTTRRGSRHVLTPAPVGREQMRMIKDDNDLETVWSERLDRVKRSQNRTDVAGMTRPPRDPDKQAVLDETGQAGPFPPSPDRAAHGEAQQVNAPPRADGSP